MLGLKLVPVNKLGPRTSAMHTDDQFWVPYTKRTKAWRVNSSISPCAAHTRHWTGSAIGWGNGLSPVWRQAITWTNAVFLLLGSLGSNFSENRIKIPKFLFIKMFLKMSSAKLRPFCPERDELILAKLWGQDKVKWQPFCNRHILD